MCPLHSKSLYNITKRVPRVQVCSNLPKKGSLGETNGFSRVLRMADCSTTDYSKVLCVANRSTAAKQRFLKSSLDI